MQSYPRRKHQTIGGDVYFASRESVDPHLHPFFSIKGNSKGWWSAVGPIVRQSDFAIVGIAAVLAAPLMQFTTLSEGAIINFCGRSGGGKTILDKFALLFAALCLGRESGLFDLAEERVTLAVSTCFHEARRALPKSPVPYAQAVEFLRVHLRDPEETPLEKKGVTINYSRSFKRRHGKIETAYVPSSRLPELVGISGLSIPPFVEHLSAIGALNGGHGAKTQTVKVCGANRRLLAFPKSFWGSSPASPVSRKV